MDVSLQGYCARYATFLASPNLTSGDIVAVVSDNRVDKISSGAFVGVVHTVRGIYALVQTAGVVTLPYSGDSPPAFGFGTLAVSGNGVASSSVGRQVTVTSVDAVNKTVSFLF